MAKKKYRKKRGRGSTDLFGGERMQRRCSTTKQRESESTTEDTEEGRTSETPTKEELFDNVWQDKWTGDGTLNVHIRRLREIIEKDPNDPKYIVTVWKEGYKFEGENK